MVLERVTRCAHCGRELDRRGLARAESRHCNACLPERLALGGSGKATDWRLDGHYLVPVKG